MATAATAIVGTAALGQAFILRSDELTDGKMTSKQYVTGMGFNGENQSPQLSWENAPEGTKSFAVTIFDMDAREGKGFWHWVIFNIPADVHALKAGAGDPGKHLAPAGTVQSMTDSGRPGYAGIAPTPGPAHHYVITVYALDKKLELDRNADPLSVESEIKSSMLAKASLIELGQR